MVLIAASSELIKAEVVAEEVTGDVISIGSFYHWVVGLSYARKASLSVTTVVACFIHVVPGYRVLESNKTSRFTFDRIHSNDFQTVGGVPIWGGPTVRNYFYRNVPELSYREKM